MRDSKINAYKMVRAGELKVGDEFHGYKTGRISCGGVGFVSKITPTEVVFHKWEKDGALNSVDITDDLLFEVPMSYKEFNAKYARQAEETYKLLHNKLSLDQIGDHEMNNSWLSSDIYSLAANIEKKNCTLIGICTEIHVKTSFFGTVLDIGVCLEEEDGERFWCHWSSEALESMFRLYDKQKNGIMD